MKFSEMKYDVPYEKLGPGNLDFGFLEKFFIAKEGKRLYKLHPEYKYLNEDPWLKSEREFYQSVVFAYMVDCILKNHSELRQNYQERINSNVELAKLMPKKGAGEKFYSLINDTFLRWYKDYLREQADPGILAREKAQRDKELQDSINQHAAFARMEEERHPHVECPYCKSTNTEKISTVSRAVSVSLVGAASGKIGKQWHCKNCNSNF